MDNFKKTNHSPNDPCEKALMKGQFCNTASAPQPKLRCINKPN